MKIKLRTILLDAKKPSRMKQGFEYAWAFKCCESEKDTICIHRSKYNRDYVCMEYVKLRSGYKVTIPEGYIGIIKPVTLQGIGFTTLGDTIIEGGTEEEICLTIGNPAYSIEKLEGKYFCYLIIVPAFKYEFDYESDYE